MHFYGGAFVVFPSLALSCQSRSKFQTTFLIYSANIYFLIYSANIYIIATYSAAIMPGTVLGTGKTETYHMSPTTPFPTIEHIVYCGVRSTCCISGMAVSHELVYLIHTSTL